MKYLDEYRSEDLARKIVDEIKRIVTRPWVLMEVCGGQTHSIVKYGIDRLLPNEIELVHGPGCPVCVTSLEMIDKAHAIAQRPDVIFCSFGDMLRVPGSQDDLLILKSRGADVRVVYSPIDCLKIARANPDKKVVFFAIGFETTAPSNAMAVCQAQKQGIKNFSMLVSHVLVPPSIASILQSPLNRVQGFLGPGHVCTVMGYREYEPLAARFKVPIVITGFEPIDILQGTLMTVRQLEAGTDEVENQYPRVVAARWQSRRTGSGESGFRSVRPQMARCRFHSEKRLQIALRISRTRRRANFRGEGNRHARTGDLHQWSGFERREEAARLRLLRQRMHAGTSVRRDDGFRRGRVRGVLRLRATSREPKARTKTARGGSMIWGAHAPSRAVFGALAENFCAFRKIPFGGSAERCTRGACAPQLNCTT